MIESVQAQLTQLKPIFFPTKVDSQGDDQEWGEKESEISLYILIVMVRSNEAVHGGDYCDRDHLQFESKAFFIDTIVSFTLDYRVSNSPWLVRRRDDDLVLLFRRAVHRRERPGKTCKMLELRQCSRELFNAVQIAYCVLVAPSRPP
jgi:hypothetical protein